MYASDIGRRVYLIRCHTYVYTCWHLKRDQHKQFLEMFSRVNIIFMGVPFRGFVYAMKMQHNLLWLEPWHLFLLISDAMNLHYYLNGILKNWRKKYYTMAIPINVDTLYTLNFAYDHVIWRRCILQCWEN